MRRGTPTGTAAVDRPLLRRGADGYEAARAGAVWNARTPPRHPRAIVRAASEDDVLQAVTYARTHGLRLSVRSGGHNWSGAPLRDDALLLDLSQGRRRNDC
ncbi:FAD-binding protein [Streptomyces lydicus]|uniref:FAD-binding protein n=1 Tax=Streptomyces lydicus TaxID=47763 RepID=UPI003321FEA7